MREPKAKLPVSKKQQSERVAIIGAGVVGSALGYLLARHPSFSVLGFSSRSFSSAQRAARFVGKNTRAYRSFKELISQADVIWITTPDREIQSVSSALARLGALRKGALVLHSSGFFSSALLREVRRKGAEVASVHPLQSFATPQAALRLIPGSVFAWEGSADARERVLDLIAAFDGIALEVSSSSKALYHSAATIVSNYTATLFRAGIDLMERSRVKNKQEKLSSAQALLGLLWGTASNLEKVGLPQALTGPIARGDRAVVAGHIRVLKKRARPWLPLYLLLARKTIPLAVAKGTLKPAVASALRRALR